MALHYICILFKALIDVGVAELLSVGLRHVYTNIHGLIREHVLKPQIHARFLGKGW